MFDRIYNQEFGIVIGILADQVAVFYFQVTFELAQVSGPLDPACFELDCFDQVVPYIHHQLHGEWLIGQNKPKFFLVAISEILFF